MKNLVFVLIFFNCINFYGQDINQLKKADTVYVYFKSGAGQVYYKEKTRTENLTYDNYFVSLKSNPTNPVQFIHHYRFSPGVTTTKKTFLKKNKNVILNYEFLNSLTLNEVNEFLVDKKKVYLIDEDDIAGNKIKLKEVKVLGTPPLMRE